MATGNKMTEQAGKDGTDNTPVIVAIGASAGGVQALQSFFGGIPQNTGAAFIVVVHLDPQHRSELSSIVGARTSMPVIQVAHPHRAAGKHGLWRLCNEAPHPAAFVGFEARNNDIAEPRGIKHLG